MYGVTTLSIMTLSIMTFSSYLETSGGQISNPYLNVHFSTPELIRNLWQLKTAVFLHWCLICVVPIDIERPKIDCLSVVMCPLLAQLKTGFFSIFLLQVFTVL